MRFETVGWLIVATSFYAFHFLMMSVRTGLIEYSRYDLVLGIALGFLVVIFLGTFLAGAVIVNREAAARQYQPWF